MNKVSFKRVPHPIDCMLTAPVERHTDDFVCDAPIQSLLANPWTGTVERPVEVLLLILEGSSGRSNERSVQSSEKIERIWRLVRKVDRALLCAGPAGRRTGKCTPKTRAIWSVRIVGVSRLSTIYRLSGKHSA